MTELRWEAPPRPESQPNPRTPWMLIAEQLRARPGTWAVVKVCRKSTYATTMASSIRCGRGPLLPAGAWEALARTVDGEHRVYARYVGEVGS